MQKAKQFLTITEASELLKVSKTSLRRWTNDGRLRCYRVGYRAERRFLQDDLLAFVFDPEEAIDHSAQSSSPTPGDSSSAQISTATPDHLCLMFRDADEHWHKLRPYLLSHLKPGTLTVYVYHGERPNILDRLREEGLDREKLIEKGRLHFISSQDSYLLDDCFDTDRMLDFWARTIDRLVTRKTKKVLLTGEMGWSVSGLPGCSQLIHYEKTLDDRLRNYPRVTTICQYSLSTIPASLIFDNLCLHPYVQLSDRVVPGLDYRTQV